MEYGTFTENLFPEEEKRSGGEEGNNREEELFLLFTFSPFLLFWS